MGFFDNLFGGKPSKDKFASIMTNALRQAGETQKLIYDPKDFRLVVEGGNQNFFNLHNVYNEYCSAPIENRKDALQRFVRSWFSYRKEVPPDFADAQPDVLPGIRSRSYYEFARLQLAAQGSTDFNWPLQFLAEHLAVSLIYDLPESMMQVQQQSLNHWGVTFEQALEAAKQNLRSMSERRFEMLEQGVWASPYRDNYDTARMLLLDLIRAHPVQGDPVAMIPNRDTLLLTGSEDTTGLENLLKLAEEGLGQPRPITGIPFRLDGDTWQPFMPGSEHPLYQKFKLMWVKSMGMEYGDQQELLKSLYEKTGQDIFVASYSAMQKTDTGEIASYSVWSEGVDVLLPQTDLIHFFVCPDGDEGHIAGTASWEKVRQIAGELMEPQGMYPVRFRVRQFPSHEQLRRLWEGSKECGEQNVV